MQKTCNICQETKDESLFKKNKNKCLICNKKYMDQYRIDNIENSIKYRNEHKEETKARKLKNKEKSKEYAKVYNIKNKDKAKEYNIKNKERILKNANIYSNNRRKNDPMYKAKSYLSSLIRNSFKRGYTTKSKKTLEILGCTFEEFRIYMETKFDEHMTWENYGPYWSIDHIKPVSLAKDIEEMIKLNHYTNLQPMEKIANIRKGNKYTEDMTDNND